MVLKYKVSLQDKTTSAVLKGFNRVYEVKSTTSLYTFHKQMRADMDFPQDQTILFKAVDPEGKAVARYSTIDLGFGTVDGVTLGQCHEAGQDSFVYFYDTTNRKSVLLDLLTDDGILDRAATYPRLVESKGPNPVEFENGYVAFEDRPVEKKTDYGDEDDLDDEDLDDEPEDAGSDDEDGAEVYDENE